MQLDDMCTLSYYKTIASLSDAHSVFLVQHTETKKIYVKKIMTVYNIDIFRYLKGHPIQNTPEIYEMIEDQDKLIVIEEYLTGDSLQELLDKNGAFDEEQVISLVRQVCTIIRQFHTAPTPIVHRDIKPSNIMISADGVLKLLDMNAAKYSGDQGGKDTVLIGTVGYAAPEQYGFGTSNIQTDIYAIGVLINVLLTGHFPQEQMASGRFGELIHRCTQVDWTKRYSSVDELVAALNQIQGVENHEKENQTLSYALPGFRTENPIKWICAGFGYLFMTWFCLNMTIEPVTGDMDLWLNRIFITIMAYAEVLFWGDYRNIQKKLGVYKYKNPICRWGLRILYAILIFFAIMLMLVGIENILFL